MKLDKQITTLHVAVMKKYPSALLMQVDGELLTMLGGKEIVDVGNVVLHYASDENPEETIDARFDGSGNVVIENIEAQWMECRPMTHRLMISVDNAIERVKDAGKDIAGGRFHIKHDIAASAKDPHYYFQGKETMIQVSASTGEVIV